MTLGLLLSHPSLSTSGFSFISCVYYHDDIVQNCLVGFKRLRRHLSLSHHTCVLQSSSVLPAATSPPIQRANIVFTLYAWCHLSHSGTSPAVSNGQLLVIDSEWEESTQPHLGFFPFYLPYLDSYFIYRSLYNLLLITWESKIKGNSSIFSIIATLFTIVKSGNNPEVIIWIYTLNVKSAYNRILFRHKKQWNSDTCCNMGESWKHMLSETSQTQRTNTYDIPLKWVTWNSQIHSDWK